MPAAKTKIGDFLSSASKPEAEDVIVYEDPDIGRVEYRRQPGMSDDQWQATVRALAEKENARRLKADTAKASKYAPRAEGMALKGVETAEPAAKEGRDYFTVKFNDGTEHKRYREEGESLEKFKGAIEATRRAGRLGGDTMLTEEPTAEGIARGERYDRAKADAEAARPGLLDKVKDVGENIARTGQDVMRQVSLGPIGAMDAVASAPGAVSNAIEGAGQAAYGVASAVAPNLFPAGAPSAAQPPTAVAAAPQPPTPGAGAPAMAEPPRAPGGSVSMSAGARGGPPKPVLDQTKELETAFQNEAKAIRDQSEIDAMAMGQKRDLYDRAVAEDLRRQVESSERQKKLDAAKERPLQIYQQALEDLNQPIPKVNPERYWQTHSKLQVALLGGLASMGSEGSAGANAVVSKVQAAIQRDIDSQKTDIANSRQNKLDRMAGAHNLIGMLDKQGADADEREKIAHALLWDTVEKQATSIALNTSSLTMKAKAEQVVAAAQAKKAEAIGKAQVDAYDAETRRMHASLEWAKFRHEQSRPKAAPAQELKPQQVERMNALQDAIDTAKDYSVSFKKNASGFFSKLTSMVPGTDAYKFDAMKDLVVQKLGLAFEKGVLREGDWNKYKNLIAGAGDLNGEAKLAQVVRELDRSMANEKSGNQAAGYTADYSRWPGAGAPAKRLSTEQEE